MSLPLIKNKKYKIQLPVSNKEIEFRELLVKEEKIFLTVADKKTSDKEKTNSIIQVAENCTFGLVDIEKLPVQDFEYLFLKIISKSVNNISKIGLGCQSDGCDIVTPIEINLDEIKVEITSGHTNKIMLDDEIGLVLKYPSITDISLENLDGIDQLTSAIDYVFMSDGTVQHLKDFTKEEVTAFLDQFTIENIGKIKKFIETTPRVKEHVEFQCKCGHTNKYILEGMQDFF